MISYIFFHVKSCNFVDYVVYNFVVYNFDNIWIKLEILQLCTKMMAKNIR